MCYELNCAKVIDFVEARNRHHLRAKKLEVDFESYQAFLNGSSLTEEQKSDFVTSLWTVIVAFVDLGYGVHPVQSAGGQLLEFPASFAPSTTTDNSKGVAHV